MKEKVLFLFGMTGSGKSDVAVELAKVFDGEIISADSVQVYRDFNIGSAKITEAETKGIPHFGIDIVSPDEEFNTHEFVEFAKRKIQEITSRKHLPIVVGGTALFVKALLLGYNLGDTKPNPELRRQLEQEYDEKGGDELAKRLETLCPGAAEKIDVNNKTRLVRALEIALSGGQKTTKAQKQYDSIIFALTPDRQLAYERINKRVDKMLANGLTEEVKNLLGKYGRDVPPLRAIGYKETCQYLDGEIDKQTMTEKIKQHTRNYAKRQLTFLRGMEGVHYVTSSDKKEILSQIIKEAKPWLSANK